MKLNDVFESTPKSVHEVISESGTCFHIPEYQRPYSWNQDKVIRLIEDIKAGCSVLVDHDDAITFLGTLLTVDDYKGASLSPKLKDEKPSKTRLVIDGQQRLTTLTLICTRLYLKLERYLITLSYISDRLEGIVNAVEYLEQINKLSDQVNNIAAGLRFFSKDTNSRDKYNRFYPLLTRSDTDVWSKQKNKASYNSAVAEYIYKVNKLSVDENFDVDPTASDVTISANIKAIDDEIKKITDGFIFESEEKSDLSKVNFKNYALETFFDIEELPKYLCSDTFEKNEVKAIEDTIYLGVFSSYLLYRTCFTFVSVNNLDYAFDMFEALNTTGEPLTAYETFRPKAIQYFHSLQENSDLEGEELGRRYLSSIDGYLNSISDATKKNDATRKLIDTFSYAFTGKVCGTHISQQRKFLIDSFANCSSSKKLIYLEQLANTAEFLFSIWYNQDEKVMSSCINSEDQNQEFKLAIAVLTSTGHEIARPFLAIAYHYSKITNNIGSLTKSAKLLTAYWVLRRAGTGGTASIDSRYKELYSGSAFGFSQKVTFGFKLLENLPLVSTYLITDLAKTFSTSKSHLDQELIKNNWSKIASKIPQYKTGKQIGICRMLLLASMHEVTIDPNCSWKTVKAKNNSNTALSYYTWMKFSNSNKSQYTIEHISPQNPKQYEWDSSLNDGELINTLGNLVILARGDNSEASNNSWIQKQELYKVLASQEHEIDNNRNYNQFIETVAATPAWTAEIIKDRSENLFNNAWDNLINWLSIE